MYMVKYLLLYTGPALPVRDFTFDNERLDLAIRYYYLLAKIVAAAAMTQKTE